MNIKHLTVLLFFIPLLALSFDENENFNKKIYKNRRAKYPVGINIIGFGPTGIAGLSIDWFLKPKLNLEFGAGLNNINTYQLAYFAGGKYHFFGNTISNTTFYLGAFDKITIDSSNIQNLIYIPFGIQRIKKSKLTWNIEVAYTYDLVSFKSQVWGAFKLGYRFNRFDKKKKKPNTKMFDFKNSN